MESGVISEGDVIDTISKLGASNETTYANSDQIEELEIKDVSSIISPDKFCADYFIRGTAKCKMCKKVITKGELRIGNYVTFKGKVVTNYQHVPCSLK